MISALAPTLVIFFKKILLLLLLLLLFCNFVMYPKDGDHPLDSLANLGTNYTRQEKLEHPYIFVASYFNHLLKSGDFLKYSLNLQQKISNFWLVKITIFPFVVTRHYEYFS
jgi:hypothetical protein